MSIDCIPAYMITIPKDKRDSLRSEWDDREATKMQTYIILSYSNVEETRGELDNMQHRWGQAKEIQDIALMDSVLEIIMEILSMRRHKD
ncbi:hypothetical protein KY290_020663 [Solanum tuberosum]|uniref:Uncharacterized protein n=1 Tax=Solanum tuberosum TaxID=4113 RepID=A0ABQ7UZC1_SOLTU|nr:hypothetical protein KY290_020663 [Solanum tuberosum]